MKIILFANTEWYLYNFRRTFALALIAAGHDVLLLSPPGPYAARLQELGLRWEPVPMVRRSLNPFREFALLLWLRRVMLRERVDLVHGFTIKGVVYGSLAARLAGVVARINSIDGLGYVFTSEDLKAKILRPLVRFLLCFALAGKHSRLILLNQDDVALFQRTGLVDRDLIRMIPGAGVDCHRFALGGQRNMGKPLRVLMAARLLWDKGLAEYVEAARLLRAQGLHIEFLLAGMPDPGNPNSVSEGQVRYWVSEGLIVWLGQVSDMAGLLSTVHIVVLPSYREGLPTALIEAAACSLPLITTDVPGCREVVTHEKDGLLVPVRDVVALAHAIVRLVNDPVLAARLGEAARENVLARFDEKIIIESMISIYSELIH